eukprot:UN20722
MSKKSFEGVFQCDFDQKVINAVKLVKICVFEHLPYISNIKFLYKGVFLKTNIFVSPHTNL